MKKGALFDTSVASPNLGDQIIMDSVEKTIMELLPDLFLMKYPTHDVIADFSYKYIALSDYRFVGGTNLLSSKMDSKNALWKISNRDIKHIKGVILFGVGWSGYQDDPNPYTVDLYQKILSKSYLHSVRDSYTENKLKSIGLNNVINTTCPTMWGLTPEHCLGIPEKKSDVVLMTVGGRRIEGYDKPLLNLLENNYEKIYFWPQGWYDYEYMRGIGGDRVVYLSPTLKAFDQILQSTEIDYIGTRLHGGIRALQHKKRTLILSVDNRATEIAKDTNLPVVNRKDLASIKKWIDCPSSIKIKLPEENIQKWKDQFTI